MASSLVDNIDLSGFKPVENIFFQRQQKPQMAIWNDAIQFNTMTYLRMSKCENIKMLLNMNDKQVIIQACSSEEPDAIRWLKNPEKIRLQKIPCEPLTRQLYKAWNWNSAYHYTSDGFIVKNDGRVMLLFDFSSPTIKDKTSLIKPGQE